MSDNKPDWLGWAALIAIIIGISIIIFYYIQKDVATCTSNPIKYASEKAIENYNFQNGKHEYYTYSILKIYTLKRDIVPILSINYTKQN